MKKIVLVALALILVYIASAQETAKCIGNAEVRFSRIDSVSNQYRYSVTIPGHDVEYFSMPVVSGMEIIYGPSTSSAQSFSIKNGATIQTYKMTFTWIVKTSGDRLYTVPSYLVYNKDRTESFRVPKIILNTDSCAFTEKPKHKSSKAKVKKDSVFFAWELSRDTVFVGDTLRCRCRLYTNSNIKRINVHRLNIDNCIIDACDTLDRKLTRISINGEKYYSAAVWEDMILTPVKGGEILLKGESAEVLAEEKYKSTDPFDMFFSGKSLNNYVTKTVDIPQRTIYVSDNKVGQEMVGLDNTLDKTYVLMDISSSTHALDFEPDRLNAEKELVRKLLSEMPDAVFASFANNVEFLSQDKGLHETLNYIDTIYTPREDGTSLSNAMLHTLLKNKDAKRMIVLCDGLDNRGYTSLHTALDVVINTGTSVDVVYFNSYRDSCDFIKRLDSVPEQHLEKNNILDEMKITDIRNRLKSTGGTFYVVKTTDDIDVVLAELKKTLPTIKQRSTKFPKILLDGLMKRLVYN